MTASWLLYYEGDCADPPALADAFERRFAEPATALPNLIAARLYARAPYYDPMLADEIGPALTLRLTFTDAAAALGALNGWPIGRNIGSFGEPPAFIRRVRQELMTDDRYPVAGDPGMSAPLGAVSYFVIYQGPSPDADTFRRYYHTNHPPLLAMLPDLKATLLYTPAPEQPDLPIRNAGHLHLCDISFDSVDALNAALRSDARVALREDYKKFPPFDGPVIHQAMTMREISDFSG